MEKPRTLAHSLQVATATCSFQLVTPDKAKQWLAHLGQERAISQTVVAEYASKMKHKSWRDYHPDAVILNESGALINGQHRLTALIQSQSSHHMLVIHYHNSHYTLGLEMTLDRGKRRSTRDVLTLGTGTNVTTAAAAVSRHLYYGIQPSSRVIPDLEFITFYRRYEKQIEEAIRLLSPARKRITLAPVMAALARALLTIDQESAGRFATVLRNGESLTKLEHGIIVLRNWLLIERKGGLNAKAAADTYARTTHALRAYVDKHEPGACMPADAELFPLTA